MFKTERECRKRCGQKAAESPDRGIAPISRNPTHQSTCDPIWAGVDTRKELPERHRNGGAHRQLTGNSGAHSQLTGNSDAHIHLTGNSGAHSQLKGTVAPTVSSQGTVAPTVSSREQWRPVSSREQWRPQSAHREQCTQSQQHQS